MEKMLRHTACSLVVKTGIRVLSTASITSASSKLDELCTKEQINRHTKANLNRFYKIPTDAYKYLFTYGGLPKKYTEQIKTFNECCLMVRKPALEIIDYLKAADLNRPVNRFVLYGVSGAGKSLTLAHLLHYGLQQEYVLVHVPWVANWMKRSKDISDSSKFTGALDLPLDAAAWLLHFKNQNANLFMKLGLKVSKEYIWTKREVTPEGSSLLSMIDHGISRVKFSSEVVASLLQELKLQSSAGKFKTMVAIDGYNAFFDSYTRVKTENKMRVRPELITLTQPFIDITNHNWKNGVCILTVDQLASTVPHLTTEFPTCIFNQPAFKHLNPFIPVRVDRYDETEVHNCIQYYNDRKWIQTKNPGFDQELKLLSCKNPYELMHVCASL